MKAQIFPIPVLVTIAVSANAPAQDRVYQIPELTDEMRDRIDLKDGSVNDWLKSPRRAVADAAGSGTLPELGVPVRSLLLDFRIWLAWHHGSNHLFVAAEMVDDFVHVRSNDRFTFGPGITEGDFIPVVLCRRGQERWEPGNRQRIRAHKSNGAGAMLRGVSWFI